jgi:hypothetical protein
VAAEEAGAAAEAGRAADAAGAAAPTTIAEESTLFDAMRRVSARGGGCCSEEVFLDDISHWLGWQSALPGRRSELH